MSENPQVDPRQGFAEPYQGPGQAPHPVAGQVPPPPPGHAPPPVPPQAPGAPSAWSQPVPPGGPGTSGPGGGRSRAWLIGGAVALVAAVVVGVVVVTSGDDAKDTASGKPAGVPGGAAKPKGPSDEAPAGGKAYSKAPKGCELIKASTIAKIAPGGQCTPGLMDDKDLASMITRMPSWEPAGTGDFQSLDVSLTVGTSAKTLYDMDKKVAMKEIGPTHKVTDSGPVDGLGEEAFVVHSVDDSLVWVKVIVRDGNAKVRTEFVYSTTSSDRTQEQTEDDAITAARDVLGSLS
ncbi:hypothetical protein [Streptomyces sp. NPDC002564]|uniref:hypothetical protein n=1 Tax=Streptomyces sp. NPDC002564 TaxID=3364649 RepID=UPI0036943C36